MECTNSSTWALTAAPAVGKKWAFSRPSSLRTSENTVRFSISYSRCSAIGGFLPKLKYSMLCLRPTARACIKSLRCSVLAWSILSITPIYTFSQKRGTLDIHVGCVSRIDCCTSWGCVFTIIVAPCVSERSAHPRSKMCV